MKEKQENNSFAAYVIVAMLVAVYLKMPREFFWVCIVAIAELFCLGIAFRHCDNAKVRELAITPKFARDICSWRVCAKNKSKWRIIPAAIFVFLFFAVLYAPRLALYRWPEANLFRANTMSALGLPLPILLNHHWYVTLGIYIVALVPTLLILNAASTLLFPHSQKARLLRAAIHGVDDLRKRLVAMEKKKEIEQDKFTATQDTPSQVTLRYGAAVTVEDFRENKELLEDAAGIDILDIREVRHGEIVFVVELAQARQEDNRMWVSIGNGGLRTVRKSERCVYFLYDADWICPRTERRGRIKIGGGNPHDRRDAGETWILNLQELGYFVETEDFNEVDLQERFAHLRIKTDRRSAGREWFYDSPEIRNVIAERKSIVEQ